MLAVKFLGFALPLLILLACSVQLSETRGGRRGGGGVFSTWRKVKKPSSSSSSLSRRTQGQKFDVPYTPLKSVKPSGKTAASYPRQQMPAGASYHASGASLPPGATYHGVSVPPGGSYYANAASMPPGAVYYAQAPPSQSAFSPGNFLIGLYAGQMMGHGLFAHRSYATHVDNQQNTQGNKVMIIENGTPAESPTPTGATKKPWPTDSDVPLAPFNPATTPIEVMQSSNDPIFKKDNNEQSEKVAAATPSTASETSSGIICVPLLVNETSITSAHDQQQVPKIFCYPTEHSEASASQIPQSAASSGIICVPHQVLEADPSDATKTITMQKQICYPAPPAADQPQQYHEYEATKSPDSVIGNIANTEENASVVMTQEAREAAATRQQQTHAVLEALHQEEQRAMKDWLFDHESRK